MNDKPAVFISKEEFMASYGHVFPPVSTRHFGLPGYREGPAQPRAPFAPHLCADGVHLRKVSTIGEKRAQYLREKAQLKTALRHAYANPGQCNPAILSLARMLAFAGKAKVTTNALCFVNTWVNNKIVHKETKTLLEKGIENPPEESAASLLHVVKSGAGLCDDLARLKLFVLEELIERKKIDLKPSDVRWIGEEVYKDGVFSSTHAVAAVRVRSTEQIWVLENQVTIKAEKREDSKTVRQKEILWADADDVVSRASYIQTMPGHLGIDGLLHFDENRQPVPHCAFNASRASYYIPDSPHARTRAEDRIPGCVGVTIALFSAGFALQCFPHLVPDILSNIHVVSESLESYVSGMELGLDVRIELVPQDGGQNAAPLHLPQRPTIFAPHAQAARLPALDARHP